MIRLLAAIALGGPLLQGPTDTPPVLEIPAPGLDDTALYRDYRTRFFRDAHGNAVQVYLRLDEGRVVHLWANRANESVGFTVQEPAGRPARVDWGPGGARTTRVGDAHAVAYRLRLPASPVELGWFLLGSMRIERDFQYAGRHLEPFDAEPFRPPELVRLVTNLERLPPSVRRRHVAALHAATVEEIRRRLDPTITLETPTDTTHIVRIAQLSLDGRNHLGLDLTIDPRTATVALEGRTVTIRPRSAVAPIVTMRVTTDAAPLTPLGRDAIFNAEFRAFAERVRAEGPTVRARRLERQIRGLELLSYEEKLMAGLPNFATYFGRDMMLTSLLMEPIWREEMLAHVLGSVLRKLSPAGEVSHEEALGGQAIREAAAEYNALLAEHARRPAGPRADTLLTRALAVLVHLQDVRENYVMVDDEFQLPVLAARYLAAPQIPAERRRAFLLDTTRSKTSAPALELLLRNLRLVSELTAAYADAPAATRLIGFPPRDDDHWISASWRDSRAGYANGRFAMDVNVIWVPQALAAIRQILASLRSLGLGPAELEAAAPEVIGSRLAAYARDPERLNRAIRAWRQTGRHFLVRLGPAAVRRLVEAKLAWLPEPERAYWTEAWRRGEAVDTLEFLALALDGSGRAIPVMNSDPATRLLLDDPTVPLRDSDLRPFLLPHPIGLAVDGLGPLVANDAYASPDVWETFEADRYHSPRVVWGREVNVLMTALARRIRAARDDPARVSDLGLLDEALRTTRKAVDEAGLGQAELWSYRIERGRLRPERYGTSSDVQLWNLTDLAVQYALARLAGGSP